MICPGQGQSCAACHMANNYLVCRANLIQDLELILRVQQLLWRWRLCCFLFDGGFIKVSVIVGCRGWHCDILWLCNRPSFHPLLSCFAIHSPVLSLSLLEHNLLHCIYCDNVSRGWMKEGGRGPYILFICCFDTHIIPKRRERERGSCYSFQVLSRYRTRVWTCFLLAIDNIFTDLSPPRWQGPQVFCFKVWLSVSD